MFPQTDPTSKRKQLYVKRETLLAVLLFCVLGAAACSKATNSNQTNSSNSNTQVRAQSPSSSSTQSSTAAEDKGDFKLAYVPVKNEQHAHLEKMLTDSKLFDRLVDDLNKNLSLPVDVQINFTECTGLPEAQQMSPVNAWYNPADHTVTMCYELMAKSEELFQDDEKTPEDLAEAVKGSTAWTFYHELGHAMIDLYQPPLTGKNEDAADQISTFILLDGSDEGEKFALSGAEDFGREAGDDNDLSDMAFADTHSLGKQRFYNIVCWVYGQNEEKYSNLVEQGALPENRAGRCKEEYDTMARSWQTLLAPHMKS
jgi:Putative metallopeptidase